MHNYLIILYLFDCARLYTWYIKYISEQRTYEIIKFVRFYITNLCLYVIEIVN